MSDDTERAGLGKVIYTVEDESAAETPQEQEEREANAEVDEGSKESFPASDPPSFMGGASTVTE